MPLTSQALRSLQHLRHRSPFDPVSSFVQEQQGLQHHRLHGDETARRDAVRQSAASSRARGDKDSTSRLQRVAGHRQPEETRSPQQKGHSRSSDSSLLQLAERDVNVSIAAERRRARSEEGCLESSDQDERIGTEREDGRRTKDFQKRARHKMLEEPSRTTTQTKKRKPLETKKPKKKKADKAKSKAATNAAWEQLQSEKVSQDRITLRPSHKLGLFKKGRTSSPVRRKGLPDLVFSELQFLRAGKREPSAIESEDKKPAKRRRKVDIERPVIDQTTSSYFRSKDDHRKTKRVKRVEEEYFRNSVTPHRNHADSSSIPESTGRRSSLRSPSQDRSEYSRTGHQARFNLGKSSRVPSSCQTVSLGQVSTLRPSDAISTAVLKVATNDAEPTTHENPPSPTCTKDNIQGAPDPATAVSRQVHEMKSKDRAVEPRTSKTICTAKDPQTLKEEVQTHKPLEARRVRYSSPLADILRLIEESPTKATNAIEHVSHLSQSTACGGQQVVPLVQHYSESIEPVALQRRRHRTRRKRHPTPQQTLHSRPPTRTYEPVTLSARPAVFASHGLDHSSVHRTASRRHAYWETPRDGTYASGYYNTYDEVPENGQVVHYDATDNEMEDRMEIFDDEYQSVYDVHSVTDFEDHIMDVGAGGAVEDWVDNVENCSQNAQQERRDSFYDTGQMRLSVDHEQGGTQDVPSRLMANSFWMPHRLG